MKKKILFSLLLVLILGVYVNVNALSPQFISVLDENYNVDDLAPGVTPVIEIKEGETLQLYSYVVALHDLDTDPDHGKKSIIEKISDIVTWNSSDETIATVDTTGKVTAVKEGTVTINATCSDAAKAYCTNSHKDGIEIKVTKVEEPKEEVEVPDTSAFINKLLIGIGTILTLTGSIVMYIIVMKRQKEEV